MASPRIRGLLVVLLCVSFGLLTACGDDGGDAADSPAPADDGAGAVGDDDGGESADDAGTGDTGSDDGTADAPAGSDDDFPLPIPDGVILDAHADIGLRFDNQRQLFYAAADAARLVAFYDEWTAQDSGSWARTEIDGEVSFTRVDGEVGVIAITPGYDPGAQADGPVTLLAMVVG